MTRTYEHVSRATEETTTSTSLTDTNASSHLTASFASGTWHIIFAFDAGAQDNAASSDFRCLIDGTAMNTDIEWAPHQDDTSDYRYRSFVRVGQLTGDGSSKTCKIQFKTSNSADPARIKNISIIAISEESGDVYHSDTTNRTTTSGSYTEYDSFTPASGDYYMISSVLAATDTNGGQTGVRCQFNGSTLHMQEAGFEDANEAEVVGGVARISPNGSQSIDIDHIQYSADSDIYSWQCLLLDLSTFEEEDYNNDTTDTSTTSTSYVQHDSVTINGGGNTEDWLILYSWEQEVNGTGSAAGSWVRVQVDGSTLQEANNVINNDAFFPQTGVGAAVYTGDGASAGLDMDIRGSNTATNVVEASDGGSWLIAAQMSGGAATQNLDPSKLTVTPTFYNPTVTTGNVNVSPSLFTVTPTFHTPQVNLSLTPSLVLMTPKFTANSGLVDHYWVGDEASGDLIDQVGSLDLDTGTISYAQGSPVAGSQGLGFSDNQKKSTASYGFDFTSAFTVGGWWRVVDFTPSSGDRINWYLIEAGDWDNNGMRLEMNWRGGGNAWTANLMFGAPGLSQAVTLTLNSDTDDPQWIIQAGWMFTLAIYDGSGNGYLYHDGTLYGPSGIIDGNLVARTTAFGIGQGWMDTDASIDAEAWGIIMEESAITDTDDLWNLMHSGIGELPAPTVTSSYNLSPSKLTVTPTFHNPSVSVGAVDLQPSKLTVTPTIHNPTVAAAAVNLEPSKLTVTPTFHNPTVTTGNVNVAPSLLTVTPTFHNPTVTTGNVNVAPSLLTVTPSIYNPVVTAGAGSLVVNDVFEPTVSIYNPTVTTGPVTVTASKLTVTPTIYNPTVTSSITVTASKLTVTPSFYNPTVAVAAVELTVDAVFTVTPTFYSPSVSAPQEIEPALLTVTPTIYAPTVTPGAVGVTVAALLTVTPTFYGPTVTATYGVEPSTLTVTPTFYAPSIVQEAILEPDLVTFTVTFYGPEIGVPVSQVFVFVGAAELTWECAGPTLLWNHQPPDSTWETEIPATEWQIQHPESVT